jgi:hypothetical protein
MFDTCGAGDGADTLTQGTWAPSLTLAARLPTSLVSDSFAALINCRCIDSRKGFYKGIQSGGAAIFWALDRDTPYDAMFGATWGCLAASLVFAAPVIFMKIQDHVSLEQDLKFSDETVEDVVAPEEFKKSETSV